MANRDEQQFDRWLPYGGVTIAYQLFSKDLAEINDYCWHALGVTNHAERAIAGAPKGDEIRTILHYGADVGRRADTLVSQAQGCYPDVENWVRLSTVVSMASLLELYVHRVVLLSLASDPGIVIARSKVVDGISLLKRGDGHEVSSWLERCIVGTWASREMGLSDVFGGRIKAVFDNLSELHALQTLRNSIAHEFARTAKSKQFWYLDPAQATPQAMSRLSANRLQSIMRVVGAVAEEVETRAAQHIGSFELLKFWHQFTVERANPKSKLVEQYVQLYRMGGFAKLISSYSFRMTRKTIGRRYCKELLKHYDAA